MSAEAIENGEGFAVDALLQESQSDGECPQEAPEGPVPRVHGPEHRRSGFQPGATTEVHCTSESLPSWASACPSVK